MTTVQIFIKIAFFVNQIMYGKAHTLTAFKVKWYENLNVTFNYQFRINPTNVF
jgi:hypothetical protein